MIKNMEYITNIETKVKDSESFSKCLLYLEGCMSVNNSKNPQVSQLFNDMSDTLLKVEGKILMKDYAKITQSLVMTQVRVQSESFKTLLTNFLQKQINNQDFPKDIKLNLLKIVELAGLDKSKLQGYLANSIEKVGVKNIAWQQSELYIKSVMEVEGKQLSDVSKKNLIELLREENSNNLMTVVISSNLIKYGIFNNEAP